MGEINNLASVVQFPIPPLDSPHSKTLIYELEDQNRSIAETLNAILATLGDSSDDEDVEEEDPLPDAPTEAAENKSYLLQVASDGTVSWVEYTAPVAPSPLTLIGKADVTESLSSFKATGVTLPATMADTDIFFIIVHNKVRHASGGSILLTGAMFNDLDDAEANDSKGNTNSVSFDQGQETDREFFVGKTSGGELLLLAEARTSEDHTIWLYQFNMT